MTSLRKMIIGGIVVLISFATVLAYPMQTVFAWSETDIPVRVMQIGDMSSDGLLNQPRQISLDAQGIFMLQMQVIIECRNSIVPGGS